MGAFPEGRPEGSAGSGVRLGTCGQDRELWLLDRSGRDGMVLLSVAYGDPTVAVPPSAEDLDSFEAEASAWYRLGSRGHVAGLPLPVQVREALARAGRRTLPGDLVSAVAVAAMLLVPLLLVAWQLSLGAWGGDRGVILGLAIAAWWAVAVLSPSSDVPGRLLCLARLPRRKDAGGTPVPNAGWTGLFAAGLFQAGFLAAFAGGMATALAVGRGLGDDTPSLLAAGGTGVFAFLLLLLVLGVLGNRLRLVRRLGDFLDRVRPDGRE